jgi:membrane protein DedA with SNARE-associated domain
MTTESISSNGPPSFGDPWLTISAQDRRLARICGGILAVLGTGSMIGLASSLYLLNYAPLLLIALSPIGRHLVLVAPIVDPVAFMLVSVTRRMLFYLPSFYLGRALGPAGIPWLEARAARFARFVRWLERLFASYRHAVVLTMAGPTVSALAGISGMSVWLFVSLALPGLILRMLIVLGFAEWMREPIEWLLTLIHAYRLPGTVILVLGVLAYQGTRWWGARGRT